LKRQVASKHDSRDYIDRIQSSCNIQLDIGRSAQVEIIEPEDDVKFVIVDGKYTFVERGTTGGGTTFIPFVGSQPVLDLFPSARIDDGAIKYIIKGADVMRPGIVKYDEWGAKDRLVIVRDDAKGRGLAIGRTLVESDEMAKLAKGNCIKNVHHAGDRIWDSYKKI
jgi:malignant T-cell-amplified sequence